jgi:hypothetical protein
MAFSRVRRNCAVETTAAPIRPIRLSWAVRHFSVRTASYAFRTGADPVRTRAWLRKPPTSIEMRSILSESSRTRGECVSLARSPAERLINPPYHLSPQSDTMTQRFHYQTISSYRVLPPKWRIIEPEVSKLSPVERYLQQVDQALADARPKPSYQDPDDLVSWVFADQIMTHEVSTRQLAHLIEERRALNQRHLDDVQWRLDGLMERRPLRLRNAFTVDDGELNDVERSILDLEKQKRFLELALWRDTQELRTALVDARREGALTRRRVTYLGGGNYGGTQA